MNCPKCNTKMETDVCENCGYNSKEADAEDVGVIFFNNTSDQTVLDYSDDKEALERISRKNSNWFTNLDYRVKIAILVIGIIAFFWFCRLACSSNPKDVPNGITLSFSASDCKNKNYNDIVERFKNAGFTNITVRTKDDLVLGILSSEDEVESVSINGDDDFSKKDVFSADDPVVITYHVYPDNSRPDQKIKTNDKNTNEIEVPLSAKDCERKDYKDIVEKFEEAGFTNVKKKAMGDLIIGFLASEDAVDKVSINDDKKFKKGDSFPKDAEVIVYYHSYSKDDSEDDSSETDESSEPDDSSEAETTTEQTTTTTKQETTTAKTTTKATTTTKKTTTTTKAPSSEYEYCFVKRGPQYSTFYLIDADKKKGVYFATNDSSVMEGNCIGDISNGFTITYTFEGGWSERLVPAGSGKIKLIDAFGQDWDYEITTVEEGESALSKIKQL